MKTGRWKRRNRNRKCHSPIVDRKERSWPMHWLTDRLLSDFKPKGLNRFSVRLKRKGTGIRGNVDSIPVTRFGGRFLAKRLNTVECDW